MSSQEASRPGAERAAPAVAQLRVEEIAAMARAVIAALTSLNWSLGRRIRTEVLEGRRAAYGARIVAALGRQLGWSHFRLLLPLQDPLAREFYAELCRAEGWSTRTLAGKIAGMLYERTALSRKPEVLLRREMGAGFAFVERQKRLVLDGDDHYLDLLFFHRRMRRLVAIELKLGDFKAADAGQVELYLRWLDRNERQPGEEAPLGIILCAGSKRETVEYLGLDGRGIMDVRASPRRRLLARVPIGKRCASSAHGSPAGTLSVPRAARGRTNDGEVSSRVAGGAAPRRLRTAPPRAFGAGGAGPSGFARRRTRTA